MKLRLTTLHEGSNRIDETVSPGSLQLDEEVFCEPVRVSGEAIWRRDHAEIRLDVKAPGHFTCDRCAEDFNRDIHAQVHSVVLLEPAPASEDDAEEGVIYVGVDGTIVDLSDEIMDAVQLAIPLKNLCDEACRGLCPYCYVNLNETTCEHASDPDGLNPPEPRGETIAEKLRKKQR